MLTLGDGRWSCVISQLHAHKEEDCYPFPVVLHLLAAVVRFAWIWCCCPATTRVRHRQTRVTWQRRQADGSGDFWFGAAHDRHDIIIWASDEQSIRRVIMDDRADGWPSEKARYSGPPTVHPSQMHSRASSWKAPELLFLSDHELPADLATDCNLQSHRCSRCPEMAWLIARA